MMKIAVMAIALVMGSLAYGQQSQAGITPEEKAHHLTTKLTQHLALNADQAAQIAEINVGIAQKNAGIRTASNISGEQKVQILQSNREARMNMYKNILTTQQYTQCEAFEQTIEEDEL
jgi:hypothetical protein